MKTLAEFKRTIAPGQVWHGVFLPVPGREGHARDMGHREVVRVQKNACTFRQPDGGESWLRFPTARDFRVTDDGAVEILENGVALLRYRRIK